jgi:hypothetical protein
MVDSNSSNLLVDVAAVARRSEQDPESASNKASTDSTTTLEASDATASSTASTTSDERSAVNVERYLPFQSTQQQILVLTQLAKQLEYYFSQQNLTNDPYLQTLRDLNDGCAPVSILANFTKIKLLLPMADDDVRIHAILQAATQYSELLRVLSIDTSTSHVTTDLTPSSAKTILAVGPVGQEPLSLSSSSSVMAARTSTEAAASSTPPLPSTVILRDVLPDVTEEQVRELFEQLQECPTVTSIHMDVGNCWYVPFLLTYPTCAPSRRTLSSRKISFKCHHHRTKSQKHVLTHAFSLALSVHRRFVKLDTTSREDMLQVMMQLRSSTLAGNPVHARLKSSVTAPVDGGGRSWFPTMPWASPVGALQVSTAETASLPKKKKTRSRGKRKKKTVSSSGDAAVKALENVSELSAVPIQVQASLSEDDFPTLLDNHVEWETPLEEHEDVNNKEEESDSKSSSKNLSDMASTATTSSCSSSTTLGYAAALRKAIANPTAVAAPSNTVSKEIVMPPTGKRKEEESPTLPVASAVLPAVKPAKWGGGRSFVDVLRTSS